MSRHAQPREVAEAKGATKVHPERYRKQPPDVALPIGNAPAHLSPQAKACWFEIESLAPLKVLKGADRISLELFSNLLAEYREDPVGFSTPRIAQLVGCLARFGMTPSDRQKLDMRDPRDTKKDGFNDF